MTKHKDYAILDIEGDSSNKKSRLLSRVSWLVRKSLNTNMNVRFLVSHSAQDVTGVKLGQKEIVVQIAPAFYLSGPTARLEAAAIASTARYALPEMLTPGILQYDNDLESLQTAPECIKANRLLQDVMLEHEIHNQVILDLTNLYLEGDICTLRFMRAHHLDPRGLIKYLRTERWLNNNHIASPLRRKAHDLSLKARLQNAKLALNGTLNSEEVRESFKTSFENLLSKQ